MPDHLPTIGFEFESATGTLPADVRVHRFRMTEAVSEPYSISLDIVSSEADYAFEQLLGHDAQISLVREDVERSVFGVITAIDWLGVSAGYIRLRLSVSPAFTLLGQQVHTRMFQQLSVMDIVKKVLDTELGVYGRRVEPGSVSRGATVREHCVQYRESNLDFVQRLLEEEGISYLFEHDEDAGKEVLQLIDATDQLGSARNLDDTDVFPIIVHNPDQADTESLQAIEWRRRVTSTGVLARDYDWRTPTSLLSDATDTPDALGRTRQVYIHGGRRFVHDDLAERAGDRKAGLLLPGARGYGRGNATDFHAGRKFTTERHELEQLADELMLMRVEHDGHDPSALPSLDAQTATQGGYRVMFECVPATAELRPLALTPKPSVRGPQTAIVTGPSGEDIHTDADGRICVQFYWDETPPYDDTSSCWVRVAQSWAGPAWGSQFIPRVGMEVVVEFLEGNPDRPLVTGCVYNGSNAPPFALPDNKTQSGIRTSSSPGGDGQNELRFEDAAGAEEIYVHAQKDTTIATLHDKHQSVGHDETLTVDNDRTKHVKHDQTVTIGNDHTETIQHDMSLTVAHNQTVTIANDHTESIANNRTESIANNASETVGTNKSVTVGAAMQVTVGGAMNATVGGAVGVEIGGAMATIVAGVASETVGQDKTVEVGKQLVIKAGEGGQLSTGKELAITAGDAMTISVTKDLSIGAQAKALIEAADELTLQCGSAKIVLKKSGDIAITGGKIDVKGSGQVSVKGSKIGNN